MLTYETFKDVRLVGAPPSSIGKFGGDTDNWMWPRHTGDFALYRIYTDANGLPSEYSEDNIAYSPKHHLPIQLDGVSHGDYSMILGFPGRTNRNLTSFGIKEALEESNPAIIEIRDKKLSVMKEYMSADPETNIKYAAKYAQVSNYWKYYIGQSKGLRRMKVYDKKLSLENTFRAWVNSGDSIRKNKYGDALEMIEESYDINSELNLSRIYLNEGVFMGPEILYFSYMIHNKVSALEGKDKKEKNTVLEELIAEAKEFYKNYNPSLDRSLLSSMLEMYYYNIDKLNHPELFSKIESKSKNDFIKRFVYSVDKIDFESYARKVFKNSVFSEEKKCLQFLNNPDIQKIKNDPAYKIINSIYSHYLNTFYEKRKIVRKNKKIGSRLFLGGLKEMMPEKKWYPDANSTLRLTYGNIYDYIPGDAMYYNYYTTIEGIMEKEDSSNSEFIIPKKLKELYRLGDYGKYADTNGTLRINFISNNDITGGNSGSPVINAWGELIGTAFDGNWEAMSGDIAFENEVQRTISVDIRYIMFIIDKYAGATHLIDEMTIAPSRVYDQDEIPTLE
ncbi:MAG: S46 family peptidase [Bacteroidota bacterium]|nr:S46 family peptidase [Bacteroidota bacterium]